MPFSHLLFYLLTKLQFIATQLKSDGRCAAKNEWSRRLQKETETCESIDQQFHTQLPVWTL